MLATRFNPEREKQNNMKPMKCRYMILIFEEGRLAHLTYHAHKSGHKTSIIIIIFIK